ncbi:uncharacterized protein [Neodiprion pinetum]|uniref:uncharacterized protein n=1 Tax=Neodiprion pinetum TaxID=441929 RepID=UPI00371A1F51
MGSPLSPILSDLVMEDLETSCINNLDFDLPFYFRYVDDILTAVPKEKIDHTLNTFNRYHPRLQFTIETEENNAINFLDVLPIHNNNNIKTDWFHKKTWSQRYLNFNSHHPMSYKIGTIINLVDRAIKLSSTEFQEKNLSLIYNILRWNDYPHGLLHQHINKRRTYINNLPDNNIDSAPADDNNRPAITYIPIPYVSGLFESLNRLFAKHNVKFVGKNSKDLQLVFDTGKDRIPTGKRSNVVYKIPCNDCNQVYIGQTGRHLNTRIREHQRNVHEIEERHTALTKHSIDKQHTFNYDNTNILCEEHNYYKRLLLEMCNIVGHTNSVNLRQDVEHLSNIYKPLISAHTTNITLTRYKKKFFPHNTVLST